jgi:hypothetical protein
VGDFTGIQTLKNKLVKRGRRVAVGNIERTRGRKGKKGVFC